MPSTRDGVLREELTEERNPLDTETRQAEKSCLLIRDKLVQQALDGEDYESLRTISALPGGFGTNEMRKKVWRVFSSAIKSLQSEVQN